MSGPITEVAFVPMMPEVDLRDPENFAYQIVEHCCKITRRQPGYERGIWGVLGNNPQLWITFTEWDDISSHEKFTKTAEHDEELELVAKMCNQPLEVFHMKMECAEGTTAETKLKYPVMDVVCGYFEVQKAKAIMQNRETHGNGYMNGEQQLEVTPASFAEGWAVQDEGPVWDPHGVQGGRPGKEIEKPWCGVFGWDDSTKQSAEKQQEYVLQKTKWIEAMGGERVVGRVFFQPY